MERVRYNDEEVAIIVRHDYPVQGAEFFTDDDDPLQVGLIGYMSGHAIAPHQHPYKAGTINEMQEVIYIVRGRVRLTMYDTKTKKVIKQTELSAGDFLLHKKQAHGFEYLEDTVIFEVKQGPYQGRQESKLYLEKSDAGSGKQTHRG